MIGRPGRAAAVCTAALLGGALTAGVWEVGRAGGASADSPLVSGPSVPGTQDASRESGADTGDENDPRPPVVVTTGPTVTARPATPPPKVEEGARAPTRLELPDGTGMPVDPAGVVIEGPLAGQMEVPDDPTVAGWYRHGASPADDAGAVVVAAHVDRAGHGAGPFAGLDRTRSGEVLSLRVGDATIRYRVQSVDLVDKDHLDPAALFSGAGPPRLHLVSCGGGYDRDQRAYAANVVVTATRLE